MPLGAKTRTMRPMRLALVGAVFFAIVECSTSTPVTSPTPATEQPLDEESTPEADTGGELSASGPTDPPPTNPEGDGFADGEACETAEQCSSGICEGQGCGSMEGICAPKARMCTRDWRAYCGCDGVTFNASGSCPGARYATKGACP